jgi:hypothetical protein
MKQLEQFGRLSQQLEKDPFMKKMNGYSMLYESGKAKK